MGLVEFTLNGLHKIVGTGIIFLDVEGLLEVLYRNIILFSMMDQMGYPFSIQMLDSYIRQGHEGLM